jgi:hypothetical protein
MDVWRRIICCEGLKRRLKFSLSFEMNLKAKGGDQSVQAVYYIVQAAHAAADTFCILCKIVHSRSIGARTNRNLVA